jgi:hypothetical protein
MNVIRRLPIVFWLLVLGYLGLYASGVVLGAFSPGEAMGLTVAALILAAMFTVHGLRVRRAMRTHGHEELMRGVHHYRERRGF